MVDLQHLPAEADKLKAIIALQIGKIQNYGDEIWVHTACKNGDSPLGFLLAPKGPLWGKGWRHFCSLGRGKMVDSIPNRSEISFNLSSYQFSVPDFCANVGIEKSAHFSQLLTNQVRMVSYWIRMMYVPYGIRTRVTAVKGQCPGPLDEGDICNGGPEGPLQVTLFVS